MLNIEIEHFAQRPGYVLNIWLCGSVSGREKSAWGPTWPYIVPFWYKSDTENKLMRGPIAMFQTIKASCDCVTITDILHSQTPRLDYNGRFFFFSWFKEFIGLYFKNNMKTILALKNKGIISLSLLFLSIFRYTEHILHWFEVMDYSCYNTCML